MITFSQYKKRNKELRQHKLELSRMSRRCGVAAGLGRNIAKDMRHIGNKLELIGEIEDRLLVAYRGLKNVKP